MKEENYIKEKIISCQNKPISLEEMKILSNLIETHICKIYNNDSIWTGFFCNIEIAWNYHLKVLITNKNSLKANDILPGKNIKISINNDQKFYNLFIDNNREIYIDEKYFVTIIEIKEEDKIDEDSFFDLDGQIFIDNSNEIFTNCEIFVLQWKKVFSIGNIKNINEEKEIYHSCFTELGSSGSPIIKRSNFKVIGIHKGSRKDCKYGTLLKWPIERFKEEIKNKKKIKENNKDVNYYFNNLLVCKYCLILIIFYSL